MSLPAGLDLSQLNDDELNKLASLPDDALGRIADQMAPGAQEPSAPVSGAPVRPQPTAEEVRNGMSAIERDNFPHQSPTTQQHYLDRHAEYMARLEGGENPMETGDRDFGIWANRVNKPQSAGFWDTVKHVVHQGGELVKEGAKIFVENQSATHGVLAAHEAADFAAVAGAKALAFNNQISRSLLSSTGGGLREAAQSLLAKNTIVTFNDPTKKALIDDLYEQHAYDSARANFADNKTAANFHKDVTAAVPGLAAILGHTEVNQDATDLASMLGPMGVDMAVAKATLRMGAVSVRAGEFAAANEAVAAARERLAAQQSVRDGIAASPHAAGAEDLLKTYGKKIAETEADIATRESAISNLRGAAAKEVEAMTKAAASRVAAGKTMGAVGGVMEKAGNLIDKLQSLPENVASKIAPESPAMQAMLAKVQGAAVLGGAGYLIDGHEGAAIGAAFGSLHGPQVMMTAGRDISRLGELWAMGDTVLPFAQNVRKAAGISGFTKQAASLVLDNAAVAMARPAISAGARVAKASMAGAAAGAAIGVMSSPNDAENAAKSGAASGAVFGATIGMLGQWQSYNSPGQIMRERAGQLRVYKDMLTARPDEAKVFNSLEPRVQEQVALYSAAHPDLKISYVNDPKLPPGSFNPDVPDRVTVNLASKDPVHEILGHEIAHYIERKELGTTIDHTLLGDPVAGVPGEFTARDDKGQPIRNAEGTAFETNEEFNKLRDQYVARINETAQNRGWSAQELDAALAPYQKPEYVAREIWAEQHLAYLGSPEYLADLKGGKRGGYFAPSDLLFNSNFLKDALAKFGTVFSPGGDIVRSNILGDFKRSGGLQGLTKEYYKAQARAKNGDVEFHGDQVFLDQSGMTKEVVNRYLDASGDVLRDTAGTPIFDKEGKAAIRKPAEAAKDSRETANVAVESLEKEATQSQAKNEPIHPDAVQRRETPEGVRYVGRFFTDDTLSAIEKAGKLNPVQLDNLRRINGELANEPGQTITHFYQAAQKKGGGGRYATLPGRWRTDLVYGIEVTKDANIIFKSISPEVLRQNAATAVARSHAKLWNNDLGALLGDARVYLENLANSRPGETGLDTDAKTAMDKKHFINNLLGVRVKKNGDVNPLFETTNAPKIAITSLRLDRMNRVIPDAATAVPFTAEAYQRAAKNLRPDTVEQMRPDANPETQKVANEYAEKVFGEGYVPHTKYDDLPEAQLRQIADHFENEAKHSPNDPEVRKSYDALIAETKSQYEAMTAAGITIEPFTGKGEPYKNSAEMMADVRDNKHLSFFLTDNGFGPDAGKVVHPLLEPSGVKLGDRELLNNDLLRAVHDYFGHTQQGFEFGPRGEFNAWKSHSRMFSEEAQGALAAETLAQNAWVNFGPHLRDAEGKIPGKGEPGYVGPKDRPFTDQRAFALPAELRSGLQKDFAEPTSPANERGAKGQAEGEVSGNAPDADAPARRASEFHGALADAAASHPNGSAVEIKPLADYAEPGTRLFLSEGKDAGAAVMADGELSGVFKKPGSTADIKKILAEAAPLSTKLNAFTTNAKLPNLYGEFDFRPVARVAFDPEQAPAGWDTKKFGTPDVVMMVRDPQGVSGAPGIRGNWNEVAGSVPLMDHDAALAAQQKAVDAVKNGGVQLRPDASEGEKRDAALHVSTRFPTAVKATEDPLKQQLTITAADVVADKDKAATIAKLMKRYPNIISRGKPTEVFQEFHQHVVDNLLYLHDLMPENLRERSKLWYEGGRKIVESYSEKYGISTEQSAGVLASLSPQMDWFKNVDLARRVIETHATIKDKTLNEGVIDWYEKVFGAKEPEEAASLRESLGKKFSELTPIQKGIWTRAHDEMNNAKSYPIVNPEGTFAGPAKNNNGKDAAIGWGNFGTIAKAVSMLEDGSIDNISTKLGEAHKVRNFFNNLLLPNAEHGDVTIDTHAVAAGLMRALAGSDIEVGQNLGQGGTPGSSITGVSGTYGLYADAYRDAAKQRGVLPREMQSITWEAVRSLFSPEFKQNKANKAKVDALWTEYKNGNLTADDARKQITDLAGGLALPAWAVPDSR